MTIQESYKQGFIDGVTLFAVWKDGKQVVGIREIPLYEFIEDIEKAYNFNPPNN